LSCSFHGITLGVADKGSQSAGKVYDAQPRAATMGPDFRKIFNELQVENCDSRLPIN
jgi:hypothetical protein